MQTANSKLVVSYGGGVNTVALLLRLAQLGERPTAIVMADPGSERRSTVQYRDTVMARWLGGRDWPSVTVIERRTEGKHRPRAWRLETLEEECLRTNGLPSVAYGWKKCSAKYKGEAQRWWIARQDWAVREWSAGRRIVKVIGYDAGEPTRALSALQTAWEDERFIPRYPLVEAGWDREECERQIELAGLPSPGKSACTYCPNNKLEEWEELRRDEPEAFARAVAMSRAADITAPDVVGLMRCNPHGKRQLHVWADGGYGGELGGREDEMPCECAL